MYDIIALMEHVDAVGPGVIIGGPVSCPASKGMKGLGNSFQFSLLDLSIDQTEP
jgi:hypothetical protein